MNVRIQRFLPCSAFFIFLAILNGCIKEPANLAYPAEILKWDEQTRQEQRRKGQKLIIEWKAAILNAKEEFTIEPGHYRFAEDLLEYPVTFEGAENMEIIASGVTFWVEKTEGSIFRFVDCKNLKIRGLTVDYDPLPFTQGTITGIFSQEKSLYMAIDPGFASPLEAHILAGTTIHKSRIFILDPEGNMRAGIRDDWVGGYEKIAGDTFRVIMKGGYNFDPTLEKYQPYQIDDKIIIPVRAGNLFRIQNSESISFENCHIYAANGIAFIATDGKGGHVFDRVNIIPRPGTGRLLSAVADGIHCYNLEKGPLVKDCRIENLGDDAVAIHGFFGIARKNESSSQFIEVINPFEYNYHKGMEIELYDFMNMKKYGKAVIEQVEEVDGPEISGLIESIREDSEKAGRRIRSFPNKKLYRITSVSL